MMSFRGFSDTDYAALQALERQVLLLQDAQFDLLPEPEREGRTRTSLAALRFFERSEHSFVAEQDDALWGAIFAQSVWQGDRPAVWVSSFFVHPEAPQNTLDGLFQACSKSAYDCAVYQVHVCLPEGVVLPGFRKTGVYAVRYLGSRAETALGEKL